MKKNTHAFAHQFVIYALVMMCCSASVGLGTVYLRHQISVTANRTRETMLRIAEVERLLVERNTEIEIEQGPDVLKRRNVEWHLGLVLTREDLKERVSEDVELRLAKKNNALLLDRANVAVDATPHLTAFASLSPMVGEPTRGATRAR